MNTMQLDIQRKWPIHWIDKFAAKLGLGPTQREVERRLEVAKVYGWPPMGPPLDQIKPPPPPAPSKRIYK